MYPTMKIDNLWKKVSNYIMVRTKIHLTLMIDIFVQIDKENYEGAYLRARQFIQSNKCLNALRSWAMHFTLARLRLVQIVFIGALINRLSHNESTYNDQNIYIVCMEMISPLFSQ